MQPLLTAEQLAPLLGVGIEQVRKLTREGSLPHHRIGGAIRYDLEAVKAATSADRGRDRVMEYRDMLLRAWGTEGDEGNRYKVAHFDGVTALARDMGLITRSECEELRNPIRDMVD